MTDWIVNHSVFSFAQHPDCIGRTQEEEGKEAPAWLKKINRGDRIVYYASEGSKLVMDMGVVTGEIQFWEDDDFWPKCWVRSFRSYFPMVKGSLLTLEELKSLSKTADNAVWNRSSIALSSGEFDKIFQRAKEKFP